MSTKLTKVCDNCGSDSDPAWYWLGGGGTGPDCHQPDVAASDGTEGIDLCGCCWQILRETLDARCFGEVES